MIFSHDTEDALSAVAALVNTAPGSVDEVDELLDQEQFEQFLNKWLWTGSRTHDEAERRAVRDLRPVLAGFWKAGDEDKVVGLVNDLLVQGHALPQLVRHDGWDYHLHATPSEAPLATRWMVDAAMAMVDVIRAGELSRLRFCAAQDCGGVLIDLSKNRSRRFCENGCGNRTNVAAYRARRRAEEDAE